MELCFFADKNHSGSKENVDEVDESLNLADEGESTEQSGDFDDEAATDELIFDPLTEESGRDNEADESNRAENILSHMSLGEKVAQLFFVIPEALTGVESVTKFGSISQEALKEYRLVGLCILRRIYGMKARQLRC